MIAAASFSFSIAVANELRDAFDASISATDMRQFVSVFRTHNNPADRAQLITWLGEAVESGRAPDRLALTMAMTSLANRNMDDALTYVSYYRALVVIDSAQCADQSSGGSLIEASMFLFGMLTRNQHTSVEQLHRTVERAMRLEAETAPVRRQDTSLCAAGMTAYAKALHVPLPQTPQSKVPEKPEAAGTLYSADPTWARRRAEILPTLPSLLLTMDGVQAPR